MVHHSEKSYFRGIAWFLTSLLVCETNDVITKYLELSLSPLQVIFGRFFFSTLLLLPLMGRSVQSFKTQHLASNLLRGFILFLGMFIWCYGLEASQLSVACLINFTTPLFTLLLAMIILKEKIGKSRFMATLFGFLGVAVVLNPQTASFSVPAASLFLLSAVLFALLDILNKILVTKEGTLTSLFYTGIFTMLFSMIALMVPRFFNSNEPLSLFSEFAHRVTLLSPHHILLLALLGTGANLLLFCILKSFLYIDVSATAPFRYVELILASIFGYLFFDEAVAPNTIAGALIIIPSVIYLLRCEAKINTNLASNKIQTSTHCC
ncbi:MAG: DMT family transporter [Puniceicoccales bacterium]|jgi:S-adenosylmethionine uptake transporter|nr:DMT family transporter [Puniceicoccales bacterium]